MSKLAPSRPVFRIDYRISPNQIESYVIKAEERKHQITNDDGSTNPVARHNQQNSHQTAFMLMRDAARGGRGRVLNDRETAELRNQAVILLNGADRQDFQAAFQAQSLWVILGLKQGLTDLEGIINQADIVKVVQILLALREEENLDRLGRILATDVFLGNRDRFNNDPGESGIQNLGNVFFVQKGTGEFKIKGLDVFDPTKNSAVMSHTVTRNCHLDPTAANVNYWGGPLLKDPIELRRMAKNALDSIHTQLSHVLRQSGRFGDGYIRSYEFQDRHIDAVVRGMNAALIIIKASCKQRLAQMRRGKADTAGLKSRMKLMNWST